ncbi:hypothetical protein QJS83_10100 [Bdellovibrio sp. 22V]|uniref:hypothetical protein n=1 Tax=Bdellovibrio sp. 22V TaxID=3044166 RepID=UPI00254288D6|nr:hypothetical protein [Bdellovibrio sp. 22V]WII70811.1 hypothetical protein QJS83_10100 [Bdellovibrio sp. 22V]
MYFSYQNGSWYHGAPQGAPFSFWGYAYSLSISSRGSKRDAKFLFQTLPKFSATAVLL